MLYSTYILAQTATPCSAVCVRQLNYLYSLSSQSTVYVHVTSKYVCALRRHFLTTQSDEKCQHCQYIVAMKDARGPDCLKSLRYLTAVIVSLPV